MLSIMQYISPDACPGLTLDAVTSVAHLPGDLSSLV